MILSNDSCLYVQIQYSPFNRESIVSELKSNFSGERKVAPILQNFSFITGESSNNESLCPWCLWHFIHWMNWPQEV